MNETAFFSGVRLDFPLGARTLLRVGHRYVTARSWRRRWWTRAASTSSASRRYTFNNTTAGARITTGPNLTVELDAGYRWSRFDQQRGRGLLRL